jgi:hypothetical protein
MPGVRVTSVRRTVRVAVALVTGQALLCGIIGFVTFGGRDGPAHRAGAAEPQLAGPPIVLPTASTSPPGEQVKRAQPGAVRSTRIERPTSPRTSAAVRSSATREITPSRTVAPSPPPAPSASPTDRALLPPSPAPQQDTPIPAVQEPCDDEGATGRTADDEAVVCLRDRGGDLRWTLV